MALTPQLLNRIAGWKVVKEGRQIFELGKVGEVSFDGVYLSGIVRAGPGGAVRVRLKTGSREIDFENHCSCPSARSTGGEMCPHAMALAWAFMAQSGGPASQPSREQQPSRTGGQTSAHDPAGGPSPRRRWVGRVLFEEADDRLPTLALRVILPPHLANAGERPVFQPFIEASLEGGDFQPLPTVLARISGMVAVSQSDENLLDFLESTGAPPGNAPRIGPADADRFFMALRDHPEVWLGRSARIEIAASDAPQEIRLSVKTPGAIDVEAVGAAPPGRPVGQWFLHERTLTRRPAMIGELRGAERASFTGRHAALFIENHLLRDSPGVTWRIDPSFREQVRIARAEPRIRFEIDGTLDHLQGRLFASYEGIVSAIPASGALPFGLRQPDPAKLAFLVPNPPMEKEARARLISAGFLPGERDRSLFVLSGEGVVIDFLANLYPELLRDWEVIPSERFARATARAEWLRPTLDLREAGAGGGGQIGRGGYGGSGIDWFAALSFEGAAGGGLSYTEALDLLNRGRTYLKRPDGRLLLLRRSTLEELQETLADFDARQERPGLLRFSKRHTLALTGLLAGGEMVLKEGSQWSPPRSLSERAPVDPPATLNATLRPYQIAGFHWLAWLSENELAGILGDEMGLGKTVQTLAWLLHRREKSREPGHFLVVCPGSLLFNWFDEARRFAPSISPEIYHGPDRAALRIGEGPPRLWITSYGVLRRDIDRLREIRFDAAVLDEAQHIKNPAGKAAQAARALKAVCRLALTGTPVENRPLDLWSIFEFLMPGYLGRERDFMERYGRPVERAAKNAQEEQAARAAMERLARRIRPFLLRRTKASVTPDLPERIDRIVHCQMTPVQQELHRSILEAAKRSLSEMAGEKEKGRRRILVFRALLRLRQVCCHPALLPREKEAERAAAESPGAGSDESGKLSAFLELLDEAVESGQRLLVFSQFTSMLAIIRAEMEHRGIRYCYLDGATRDRAAPVREFQSENGPPAFLISLKAGGTGLNLTAADHVVLFDPWWNPAIEEQAAARAHRIGRSGMVTVHRLIAAGSIEENVLKLQKHKRSITDSLVGEADAGSGLTASEIEELLMSG